MSIGEYKKQTRWINFHRLLLGGVIATAFCLLIFPSWDNENTFESLEMYKGYKVVDKQEGVLTGNMTKAYRVYLEKNNETIEVLTTYYHYDKWQVGQTIK